MHTLPLHNQSLQQQTPDQPLQNAHLFTLLQQQTPVLFTTTRHLLHHQPITPIDVCFTTSRYTNRHFTLSQHLFTTTHCTNTLHFSTTSRYTNSHLVTLRYTNSHLCHNQPLHYYTFPPLAVTPTAAGCSHAFGCLLVCAGENNGATIVYYQIGFLSVRLRLLLGVLAPILSEKVCLMCLSAFQRVFDVLECFLGVFLGLLTVLFGKNNSSTRRSMSCAPNSSWATSCGRAPKPCTTWARFHWRCAGGRGRAWERWERAIETKRVVRVASAETDSLALKSTDY